MYIDVAVFVSKLYLKLLWENVGRKSAFFEREASIGPQSMHRVLIAVNCKEINTDTWIERELEKVL